MVTAVFFANTDWYLYNFRLPLAEAVRREGLELLLVSPAGPYVERLQAQGFRWRAIEFCGGSMRPFSNARLLAQVYRLYKDEQPDVVHHFTIKCVLYGGAAARRLGIPRINAVPGRGFVYTDERLTTRLIRRGVNQLYRYASGGDDARTIFQNNEDLAYFQRKRIVDPRRTTLIRGSGVDCERFKPSQNPRRNGPCRVLFASRLLKEKGVHQLIAAARRLHSEGARFELIIAGDVYPANPSSLTLDEIDEIRRSGVAKLLGHVDDMPRLLSETDVVVLPSEYGEGLPRILAEAAACAKPLVATDTAGCRDIVRHGVNGELISVGDVDALANALRRLITDNELCRRYGSRSREIAVAEFSETIVIEQTLAIYRQLLNRQDGGRMLETCH